MVSLRKAFLLTLLVLSVPLGLYFLYRVRGIIILILIAIVFATAIRPLVIRLQRRGLPMSAAILLVYAAILLALLTLSLILVPPFVEQASALIQDLPTIATFIDSQIRPLEDLVGGLSLLPNLAMSIDRLISQVPTLAAGVLHVTFTFVWWIAATILVLVVAFYWLSERDDILHVFLSFVDPMNRDKVQSIVDEIELKLGSFVRGQLALSAIVGIMVFVGLSLLGIDFAVVLAIFAAITEFIPIIGPFLGAVPAVIIALLNSPLYALIVVAMFIVIQEIEGNVLVPKVMERAVGMSPLTVLIALLIGGSLLGVLGALLAVPVAAVIHVVVVRTVMGGGDRESGDGDQESGAGPPTPRP